MKMIGFSFLNQAEDNLKDYALSYVKSYRDGIERDAAFEGSRFVDQKKQGLEIDDPGLPIRSDTDRTVPFAVLNMRPYFWWKLRGVLERLDVNVGLSFCSVAGPYFEGTQQGKLKVAKEVDKACIDIGFLVITGHQIDPNFINDVYKVSEDFFDLPEEEKFLVI